jgi:hypothetical protein
MFFILTQGAHAGVVAKLFNIPLPMDEKIGR